ncbi:hypothetical protein ABZ400_37115 [Streptomyces sp. NPDC005897]|uniref:hypothetical protein n=1 Tax=Streptomyces sp. NPDC005897 TaxID=3157081 RepID=UPI0033FF689C
MPPARPLTQALLARTTTLPVPAARPPHPGTGPTTGEPAQHDGDDSIDDLDDFPDDNTHPAAAAGFGLYDAHKEADKW